MLICLCAFVRALDIVIICFDYSARPVGGLGHVDLDTPVEVPYYPRRGNYTYLPATSSGSCTPVKALLASLALEQALKGTQEMVLL